MELKMAAIRKRKLKQRKTNSISKLDLINGLETMNKFQDAIKILKTDNLLYEKWSAATEIKTNDKNVRSLLETIGLDPDEMLSN
jgi:hypothetical protein